MFTKEEILKVLNALGLSENIRGEALTLEQFAQLTNYLTAVKE
jgi:16S rRNA (adenine1518-N6/adenine1519-N6)-dimethyltransferase